MRRFRLIFLVVGLALLAPMILLVGNALRSVDRERQTRHQAVAERLFDEMERALSEVLSREEERPFGQYSFSYASPDHPGGSVRSPLAAAPTLPFVVGHFQIDPDGSLHTPMQPRDGQEEGSERDWQPSAESAAAIAEIEQRVGHYWRSGMKVGTRSPALAVQLPGSTIDLMQRRAPAEVKDKRAEVAAGAFDALRALNKGVEQRADRQTKVSREYAPGFSDAPAASADLVGRPADDLGAAPAGRLRGFAQKNEATQFELSPMVGRVIDAHHLLLYRTVVHERQGYRQGLLVDVDAMATWLQQRAIGSTELEHNAQLAFGTPFAPLPAAAGERTYQHRFAEPFDDVSAQLVLTALPDGRDATYIYALCALLLGTAGLGLAALYRMGSVVLRYAERRSNFVAAVTHELKTPLTAIRLYGEMLRDGMVASEAKRDEYHRHITAESERLTRLVNNVLELSRLEKHTRQMSFESGSLGPVVHEVADLVRPHVESAGFTLCVDVDTDLPVVRFERDALMQVLFNLVDNAVKYADGAVPKEIVLRCRRDGDTLRITVRDYGPGVPARHLRQIFEPFYRAESELTRRHKGTGIGLALVRGLVERMEARVTGRNLPEGGFEVAISFRAERRVLSA